MLLLFVICSCLLLGVVSQRIQLFVYNQTKNCKINIIEEKKRILMYGEVDFTGDIQTSFVNFEFKRKKKQDFQYFHFVKVPGDCGSNYEADVRCFATENKNVYQILLNITAYKEDSEAEIRAYLFYNKKSFYSDIRKLPIVYGPQTDALIVYANDQIIHNQHSNVTLNTSDVTIFSTCLGIFAPHCELKLANSEAAVLTSGIQVVAYNTMLNGTTKFELIYIICNIQRNFSFFINTGNTEVSNHQRFCINVSVVIGIIVFVSLVLLICLLFCILRRLWRWFCSHFRGNKDESQSFLYETNKWDRESNENSKKSDDYQKKRTIIKDVPSHYRDTDFEKLLKVLLQLTCRINLKRQLFSSRSRNIGSGLVTSVLKYINGIGSETANGSQSRVCPCPKCHKSKSPSRNWGEILITTSSAIMKNKNYHKQILCVLSTGDKVTTELRDLLFEHKDSKKSGQCVLKYITCDQSLLNKLETLLEERYRLEENVLKIYNQEHEKIYFSIVYDKHGKKDICNGNWSEEKPKEIVRTYHYEPEICHGNIGAPVVLMGYSNREYAYKKPRTSSGEASSSNVGTAVFTVEVVQKVKYQ